MTYKTGASIDLDVTAYNQGVLSAVNSTKKLNEVFANNQPIKGLQSEISKLKEEYKLLELAGGSSKKQLVNANKEIIALEKEATKEAKEFQKALKEQALNNKIIGDLGRLNDSLSKVNNTSVLAGVQLEKINKQVTGGLIAFATVTLLAFGVALGSATKEAINLHDAIVRINQIGQFDNKALDGIKSDLLELSRLIPLTTTELAEITKGGVQAGLNNSQLKEYTELVAQIASAFEVLPKVASDSFGSISNVYQLSISELRLVADAVNTLADTTSRVNEADLINVLERAAGAGQAIGLTAQQVAALGASLLSFGNTPEVVGTSISTLLLKLSAVEVQTEDFRTAIKKLGFDVKEFAKLSVNDGQKALNLLFEKLSKLDKLDRNNTVVKLFGGAGQETSAVLKLLNNLGVYNNALLKVSDSTQYAGSVNKAFETSLQSISKQYQILKNNFSELGVNIGDSILPFLAPIITALSTVTKAITDFAKEFPKITTAIVAGLTSITLIVGAVGVASLASIPSVVAFGTALYTALAPVLPIIAGITLAIGALVAGALLIPPAIDKVKSIFDNTFITIGDKTRSLSDVLSATFSFIKDGLVAVGVFISDRFNLIIEGIKNYFIGLGEGIARTGQDIANTFIFIAEKVKSPLEAVFTNIKYVFYDKPLEYIQAFGNLFGIDITSTLKKSLNDIVEYARNIFNQIKKFIADAFNVKIDKNIAQDRAEALRQFRASETAQYNNANPKLPNLPPSKSNGGVLDYSKPKKEKSEKSQEAEARKEILASLQKLRDSRKLAFAQIKADNDVFNASLNQQTQELNRNLSDGLISSQTYYAQAIGNLLAETTTKRNNLVKQIAELNDDLKELNNIQSTTSNKTSLDKIQKEIDAINAKKIELLGQIKVTDIDYNTKKTGLEADASKKKIELPEIQAKLKLALIDRNIEEVKSQFELQKQQNIALNPVSAFAETFNALGLQEDAQRRLIELEKQKVPVQLAEIARLEKANQEIEERIRKTNNGNNTEELISTNEELNKNLELLSNLRISLNELQTKFLEFDNLKNIFKDLGSIGIGALTSAFTELESGTNRGIRAIKKFISSILEGLQQILAKSLTNQIAGAFVNLLASAGFRSALNSSGFGSYGSGTTGLDGIGRASGGLADEKLGNVGGIGHKGEFVFNPQEAKTIGLNNLDYLNGYTGNGGKYQEAGLLKQGSYVINKQSTNALGLDLLYDLKNNTFPSFGKKIQDKISKLKGYDQGGLVGSNTQPVGAINPTTNAGFNINVEVINNSRQSVEVDRSRLLKEQVISIILDDYEQVGQVGQLFRGA